MTNFLKQALIILLFSSTCSFAQNILKVDQNKLDVTYFDKSLGLYFSIPVGWKAVDILSEAQDIPPGIGLIPAHWDYTVLDNGDTLDQSEYAIEIRVGNASIDSISKSEGGKLDGIRELKNWRYYKSEEDTRLYIKDGGYYGMDSFYWSVLDNRHGKCVWVKADPLYKELRIIYKIENSLRLK